MTPLSPEHRVKLDKALQPFVDALVNTISTHIEQALLEQIQGVLNGEAPKSKTAKKKRTPSNGTGKKHPRRTDLSERDRAVLKAVKQGKDEGVKMPDLDEKVDATKSCIHGSLKKLVRYGLIKQEGYGRGTTYTLIA